MQGLTDFIADGFLGREAEAGHLWHVLLQLPVELPELRVPAVDVPLHCPDAHQYLHNNNIEVNKGGVLHSSTPPNLVDMECFRPSSFLDD